MNAFLNLLRWHLGRERGRILVLAGAVALVTGIFVAVSGSVEPAEFRAFLQDRPFLKTFMRIDTSKIFTADRWIALIHGHPLWFLLVLAFPITATLRAIAQGIDDGTLEVVLAQPVSRGAYFGSVAAAVGIGTAIVVAASALGGIVAGGLAGLPDAIDGATLARLSFSGGVLALAAAAIAALAASVGAGGGTPGRWALGIVVASFFVRFLADFWPAFAWAKPFSIFSYHDPQHIVDVGGLPGEPLACLAGVAAVCAVLGLLVFRKRQFTF